MHVLPLLAKGSPPSGLPGCPLPAILLKLGPVILGTVPAAVFLSGIAIKLERMPNGRMLIMSAKVRLSDVWKYFLLIHTSSSSDKQLLILNF